MLKANGDPMGRRFHKLWTFVLKLAFVNSWGAKRLKTIEQVKYGFYNNTRYTRYSI